MTSSGQGDPLRSRNDAKRFAGKTVLITGASRGLGRATAIGFAREGATLILLARTRGGLEEADDEVRAAGGTAALVELDLTDGAKLDALGPSLFQRFGHIDAVIANAGSLGPLSPLSHISDKDWTHGLAVNLTANWRLIRTLDPLLRLAKAGRAVFVTAAMASDAEAYWGSFAVSKAGLNALVSVYAKELASTQARANLFDPGPMRTALRAKAMPGEEPSSVPEPTQVVPIILSLASADYQNNGQLVRYAGQTAAGDE